MNTEDKTEDEHQTPPKKKAKINQQHRPQKFRDAWLSNCDFKLWLMKVPNDPFKAKCKICNIILTSELTVIKNHQKNQKHQRKLTQPEKKIETFFNQSHCEPNKSNDDSIYLEIKLSAFLVEHNISFTILDHLTPLLKECIKDSTIVKKMQLKADKGAAIAKNILGRAEKDDLQDELKSSLFSILIDESTDISGVKTMCIIVRYFSPQEERIISKFWELCQVFGGDIEGDQASAEHLFKLVSNSFESHGIPSKHIIGFASDGCNTMMGNKNSVASRFEEQCPGIYIFKCICHSLHLCASEACKQLPRSCEDLARNIYNEFKNSAKRQFLFREFQSFLDIEIHKILRPAQTRWLSLSSVVNRIVEQWEALKLYFSEQALTARVHSVEQIVQSLNNPLIKLLYLFLKWVLPKFTKLNALFQSKSVILSSLYEKMSVCYRELLETYLCKNYIDRTLLEDINPSNEEQRLRLEQIYLGVDVMSMLDEPEINSNERLKTDFRMTCLKFLEVGCNQIKQRFNFNDNILKLISNLNPSKAMLRKTREQVHTLFPLMKALPRIVANPEQCQAIDDEWRQLPFFELPGHINLEDETDLFWAKLLKCDEGDQGLTFKNISQFALDALSLPFSNADCERIFSQVNLIKTKSRNKMITPTLNGLLLAKQRVQLQENCINFKPSKHEFSYFNTASMYPKKIVTKTTDNSKISDLYENEDLDDILSVILPNE